MGFVFHPEFGLVGSPNRGYVYVYYRYKSPSGSNGEWGYSRLTRFTVPMDRTLQTLSRNTYLSNSLTEGITTMEEVCFSVLMMGSFYLSIGDEGGPFNPLASTQKIHEGFFSGILRIDVDKRGGNVSHPIIRQPQSPCFPS